jgi:hypothetical protein
MIVGLDTVKHGKNKRKFIMTASYDANFSKFYTEEVVSETDEGVVSPIGAMLRRGLDYFYQVWGNKFLPMNIIIYRSGITDPQKKTVLRTEIPVIVNLFSGDMTTECYKDGYTAKFCYVVVNKKCDVKFFEVGGNNLNNPKEGTVVDTQVVSPDLYEFYMQPQYVNQGTATPTHFHCIYDTTGIPIEILEEITYKQCYYYWNWPGAIREPAALKFAGTANTFSSKYMRGYVKDKLKNSPYYI